MSQAGPLGAASLSHKTLCPQIETEAHRPSWGFREPVVKKPGRGGCINQLCLYRFLGPQFPVSGDKAAFSPPGWGPFMWEFYDLFQGISVSVTFLLLLFLKIPSASRI